MHKRFFILLFMVVSNLTIAQSLEQQTDSLLNLIENETEDSLLVLHYYRLAQLHFYKNPSFTLQTSRKGLQLSKEKSIDLLSYSLYLQQFNAHHYIGSPADTLLKCVQELEAFTLEHLEELDLISVYWDYALYYSNIGATDKELEYYLTALDIAQKHNVSPEIQGSLLSNIGDIYMEQEKYPEALEQLEAALEQIKDDIGLGVIYQTLGELYNKMEKYDLALENFKKAYTYHKKGKDIKGMCWALIEEGKYHDRNGQFETANSIFFNALDLIEENDIGRLYPSIYLAFAQHYHQKEEYTEAINYGEEALAEMQFRKNYKELNDLYNVLQNSYEKIGNFKKAYEIRGFQMVFNDSIQDATLLTKVAELQTKFEVDLKESENETLRAEKDAKEKTIQSNRITGLALILSMLLIGSWAIVVYRNSRQKQKYNEQLEVTVEEKTADLRKANEDLQQANQELKTFNYIASHDIKEPIRNIGNYAEIIFRKLPQELQGDFKTYFDTVKNSTAQLYTLVEDFSRYTQLSKNDQIEFQEVDLNQTISNLELNLSDIIQEKKGQIIKQDLPQIQTSSSLIYTVLKNIVENGLKFNQSPTPTINISYKETDLHHEIYVQDNGIGIAANHQDQIFEMFKRLNHRHKYKGSGIGLAIVKLLLNKMNGQIVLESELDKGTTFIIQLPK